MINITQIPKFSLQALNKLVVDKYISRRKHPTENLWILAYTTRCQIDRMWTVETTNCRGLIVDAWDNIVARPFKKFFSIDQYMSIQEIIPNLYNRELSTVFHEPFTVQEKLDGSLGIMYSIDGKNYISTKGTFTSPQAIRATKILHEKYAGVDFNSDHTYLFEIIYKDNRIVLDYGKLEDLILLAVINTATGLDDWAEFTRLSSVLLASEPSAPTLYSSFAKNLVDDGKEGYVLVFVDGFRVKYKHVNYLKIHRLLTGVTVKRVWEFLRDGLDINKWLESIPDEFLEDAKNIVNELKVEFYKIVDSANNITYSIGLQKMSRKDIAIELQDYKYRSIVFNMLDGKYYEKAVWNLIKPKEDRLIFKVTMGNGRFNK